jgi:proteasome assembly chaperone 2
MNTILDLILSQPIVSAANVSQLAADLLIASLDLKCIGLFDSQYLVPALGARDDGDGITMPLECMFHRC